MRLMRVGLWMAAVCLAAASIVLLMARSILAGTLAIGLCLARCIGLGAFIFTLKVTRSQDLGRMVLFRGAAFRLAR